MSFCGIRWRVENTLTEYTLKIVATFELLSGKPATDLTA